MFRPLTLSIIVSLQLILCLPVEAAPDAFIPPKWKGIVLYAPVPNYPEAARSHYTLGAQGVYRLKINPKTGLIDEVGVLKHAGHSKLDGAMIFELFKWRIKPGALKELDVPVLFESMIRVELKNAAGR